MESIEKKNEDDSGNLPESIAVVCTWVDATKRMNRITVDPFTGLLSCEGCKSNSCLHVKYAMKFPRILEERDKALKSVCRNCHEYNFQDALYCNKCGSKLEA